jgi:hypothetical protein
MFCRLASLQWSSTNHREAVMLVLSPRPTGRRLTTKRRCSMRAGVWFALTKSKRLPTSVTPSGPTNARGIATFEQRAGR